MVVAALTKKGWWGINNYMGYSKKKYQLMLTREFFGDTLHISEEPQLFNLLDQVFDWENICRTATLIDLHSYRVHNSAGMVKKALLRRDRKPFVFVIYNN